MQTKEKALEFHKKGFNCAQSVLCACGEDAGLDEKQLLAVAGGLGGGVRCGEICGAVTGGVMAIGLKKPYNSEGDNEAKDKIAKLTVQYTADFKERFGCIRCVELKSGRHSCPELIACAAEAAEKLLKEEEN